ncbi:MAG: hypothetical protein ACH346_08090 [Chthoniobacterales bacterium]
MSQDHDSEHKIHQEETVKKGREVPAHEFDDPWKYVLTHFFKYFMEFCLPELTPSIDWSRGYEPLDKELQKIMPASQNGKKIADLLFKIWLKSGEEKWILVHLEVQAQKRDDVPERMYVYNYRAYDRYQKPVIGIALLLDSDPKWRPNCFEMKNSLLEREDEPYLQFRYHVIKLIDYAARKKELHERKDLFAKVILAQLIVMETKKNLAERVEGKISLIKELLRLGLTSDEARELIHFIDWLIKIPEDLMITYNEQIKEIAEEAEEEWNVPYVSMFEQAGLFKGRQEGRLEGKAEIILAMQRSGLSCSQISQFAGIPQEEVQKIVISIEK